MDSRTKTGDFVFKAPAWFNEKFYKSAFTDKLGKQELQPIYARVLCTGETMYLRDFSEREYLDFAKGYYKSGGEEGVPFEDILLVQCPEWHCHRRQSLDTRRPPGQREAGDAEDPNDCRPEGDYPGPVKLTFAGEKEEHLSGRTMRKLYGGKNAQPSIRVTSTFSEDSLEGFLGELFSKDEKTAEGNSSTTNGKRKLKVKGSLRLAGSETPIVDVNFTGTYEGALKIFPKYIEKAK